MLGGVCVLLLTAQAPGGALFRARTCTAHRLPRTTTETLRIFSITFDFVEVCGKTRGNLHGFLRELFSSGTACEGVVCVRQEIIVIFICTYKSIKLPLTIIKI